MDLSPLPESYQPLMMKHGQTLRLRLTRFELGTATVTRKDTGEAFTKRALGIAGVDPRHPAQERAYRVLYQQVIDTLLPTLQAAQGAPVDVLLRAFGYRNRVTFTVEVG